MVRQRVLAASLFAMVALSGCSDGDDESGSDPAAAGGSTGNAACDQADTFTSGMSRTGAAGFVVSLMSSDPAPPARHDNSWTIHVADPAGDSVLGATIVPAPAMPQHGHGTNRPATVSELSGGEYALDPINLFMPGLWEIPIEITSPDGQTDSVTFSFCVGS